MGAFENSLAIFGGPGECTPAVTKQLTLGKRGGNRRGVHRHKWAAAGTQPMNLACNEFLASSGLADNENIHRCLGGLLHLREQTPHTAAQSDKGTECRLLVEVCTQLNDPLLQTHPFDISPGDAPQLLNLKRLGDIVGSPQAHAIDSRVNGVIGGDHDDLPRLRLIAQSLEHAAPAETGHVQIEKHQSRVITGNRL